MNVVLRSCWATKSLLLRGTTILQEASLLNVVVSLSYERFTAYSSNSTVQYNVHSRIASQTQILCSQVLYIWWPDTVQCHIPKGRQVRPGSGTESNHWSA
jgi:hypothetical protein